MEKLRSIAAADRSQAPDFVTVFGDVANFPEINAWSAHAFDPEVTRMCHVLARLRFTSACFGRAKGALEVPDMGDNDTLNSPRSQASLWWWRDDGLVELAHRIVEAERQLERAVGTAAQSEARRLIKALAESAQTLSHQMPLALEEGGG